MVYIVLLVVAILGVGILIKLSTIHSDLNTVNVRLNEIQKKTKEENEEETEKES